MTPAKKVAVVVNPRSAGGKTARRWPGIEKALRERLGSVETRFTQRPGHAIEIARELAAQGFERIIAAGGDGTINEVANGLVRDDGGTSSASLGVLPLGTGGDFRRTLGISLRTQEAVDTLVDGQPVLFDVGKITYRAWDGRRESRHFLNVTSFGMGGEVASRAGNALGVFGGKAAFLCATAIAFLVYRRKKVRLRLDGSSELLAPEIYNVAVGNGRFHGGGMQVCPKADPRDGALEVTVIEYLRRWEAVRDFPVLYSDDVYRHPKVKHLRAMQIVAEADEEVRIEVDGEPLGTLPLEISVLPRCLPVVVPSTFGSG